MREIFFILFFLLFVHESTSRSRFGWFCGFSISDAARVFESLVGHGWEDFLANTKETRNARPLIDANGMLLFDRAFLVTLRYEYYSSL